MPDSPLISYETPHDYAAFSDESHSDAGNRYMVIGGVLLRSNDAHEFGNRISEVYKEFGFPETIQWKSTSVKKIPAYKAVVDEAVDYIHDRKMDFGCIVFDQQKVDHARYNEKNPETGFFKFLFQHHLKWSQHYAKPAYFRCFHGNMDTGYDLNEMLRCLNGKSAQRNPSRTPYIQFDFLPVKRTRCMQVADLLIGAVGYAANGGVTAKPGTARTEICEYIRGSLCLDRLDAETAWPDRGCHIWRFRM